MSSDFDDLVSRAPRWSGVAAPAVALCALLLAVLFVALRLSQPYDGARMDPEQLTVWRHNGVEVTPLDPGSTPLRSGDVVVGVAGRSLESWTRDALNLFHTHPVWQAGNHVPYRVLRKMRGGDGVVPITLRVRLVGYPLAEILPRYWSVFLFGLVTLLVAVYVFVRRPREPAAPPLLVLSAGLTGSLTWLFGLQVSDLIDPRGLWLYQATTFGVYMLLYTGSLHFALVFPRRHALLEQHRWIVPGLYLFPYVAFAVYLGVLWASAGGVLVWLGSWGLGETLLGILYLVAFLVVAVTTYRRLPDAVSRQQIRLLLSGGLIAAGALLVLWLLPEIVLGRQILPASALGLTGLPFPLALAAAIFRYRLFDIDTVVHRTLVYASLTACVVTLYVLVVGYLGSVLRLGHGLGVSLLATGVVAVLFQPLHQQLHRAVSRLVYGERDEPYTVVSRLGHRLEDTLTAEAVLPTIVETVAQALKLPYVAILLTQDGAVIMEASTGQPVPDPVDLPLFYHQEVVGRLLVAPRQGDEALSRADRHLLEDLATQAGVAAHAVRLTAELQRSRERLVAAREEERRRLRRDLHDGLGPMLGSVPLKLDVAVDLLGRDPEATRRILLDLKSHMQTAILDIRRLVYALRPPSLDDLGFVPALRETAAQYTGRRGIDNLRITIDAPDLLPPLPAAVEVAAFRIAQEAMTNVVKHAAAHSCMVRIRMHDPPQTLSLEVRDDGRGLPPAYRSGVGLSSMRERAQELGGECAVRSLPEGGTCVRVVLPLSVPGAGAPSAEPLQQEV